MTWTELGSAGACLQRDVVRKLGRHRVRTGIGSGEFSSPWPGVLVDPKRATEPLTLATAACLVCGSDAVVAGPTAARLHGFTAVEATPIHVMVPYETSKRSRPGLIVHNGLFLAADRDEVNGLPVLGIDRVVTDLLCTARPQDALAVVDQVIATLDVPAGRAFRRRIAQRLRDRPDPRGTRVGTRLLDLATGKAESPAESWLLWRIVDLGFPVPEANTWACGPDGNRLYRIDLSWPGLRIAVEYNGYAAHAGRSAEDDARVYDLGRRGWIVIEVRVEDLRSMTRVEEELHDAFVARGIDLRGRNVGAFQARRHRERRAS